VADGEVEKSKSREGFARSEAFLSAGVNWFFFRTDPPAGEAGTWVGLAGRSAKKNTFPVRADTQVCPYPITKQRITVRAENFQPLTNALSILRSR